MYTMVAENSFLMTLESESFGFVVKTRAHYQLSRESHALDLNTLNLSGKSTDLFVLRFMMNLVINRTYATPKGKTNQKLQELISWSSFK